MPEYTHAVIVAGNSISNLTLYHRIRFSVGDPTVAIDLVRPDGTSTRVLMIRDIEADRAKEHARADSVITPADAAPDDWARGDRELETAQSLAECLVRAEVTKAVVDRTFPAVYAHYLTQRGIAVECDTDLGISDRRVKDEQELQALRDAQKLTEACMETALTTIARADADASGVLQLDGAPLTSERMVTLINTFFMQHGASSPHGCIVAPGPIGADCHDRGRGEIRTGEPVIVDLFPYISATRYNGDCTRCVVHGDIPGNVAKMHAAVVDAQGASINATRAGVSARDVHKAATDVIEQHGYRTGSTDTDTPTMVHGTGHGIGLDVHEPPLLDIGGPPLLAGDVVTIEPGLYHTGVGGIRIEDMVAVTQDGHENFNTLPKGLTWK